MCHLHGYIIDGHQYGQQYTSLINAAYKLTHSFGHTVKEYPLPLCVISRVSSEADIVTGLNADHREEVQFTNMTINIKSISDIVPYSVVECGISVEEI